MWIGEIWRRLQYVIRRREFENDLEDEIRLHLELRAEQDGASARRQFGNATQIKETSREMWSFSTIASAFLQDAKYGMRTLAKSSGFTGIAVLTLALGLGASTAVFSLIDAI